MQKVDKETVDVLRRLKSFETSSESKFIEESAAAPPAGGAGEAGAGMDQAAESQSMREGGGGGGGGEERPSSSSVAATTRMMAPYRGGNHQLQLHPLQHPHQYQQQQQPVFLPHLNLENRFLVSAQVGLHYGGYLMKRGAHMKVWRKRWFTVEHDCIMYRKSPEDYEVRGCIPLVAVRNIYRTDNVKSKAKYHNACICIKTDWRTYVVVAETALEARQWNFYLFRVWRDCVLRARKAPQTKVENISNSDLVESLDAGQADAIEGGRTNDAGGDGDDEKKKKKKMSSNAITKKQRSATEQFVEQIKSIERLRSLVVRRLWKLAYKLVVLDRSVTFAKDVAEIYKDKADSVMQQRLGDTQVQRRAQESIRLLKSTLRKVNGLYEQEIGKRQVEEAKVATLSEEMARLQTQLMDKDKENRQLEEDVLQYQEEVKDYYKGLRVGYKNKMMTIGKKT